MTALAAYALAHRGKKLSSAQREKAELAVAYLRRATSLKGCVANLDGSLDYPEYATAMALEAAPRLGMPRAPEDDSWRRFLLGAQLQPSNGFASTSYHCGGWDLLGASRDRGLTTGGNISITAFALEGLASATDDRAREARERALLWLGRCQNSSGDGGFFFTPDRSSEANKAQWLDREQRNPRSYGSATCDGLRALLAGGVKSTDARVKGAVAWLAKNATVEKTPGFEEAPRELGWAEGLSYYYLASLSKCLFLLPKEEALALREKLAAWLTAQQREEGNWKNASPRMREDDPLIATCFGVVALAEAEMA